MRELYFVVLALVLLAPLAEAKTFEFPADTFSFSNALYFEYRVKPDGELTIQKRANGKVPDYSRHCFVLVRGVLQLGNWRIVLPVPRSGQKRLAYRLRENLDRGLIQSVYMTRFRPINHCLVVYTYKAEPNGDLVFSVYDVNQPGKLVHLRYLSSNESFYFDKTWYYPGGLVNILPLYVSPLT